MQENGRHANLLDLTLHPPLAFLRNYLLKGGIRDGVPGLAGSAMNSYYVFLKFAKLWELRHRHPLVDSVVSAGSERPEEMDGRIAD